MTRRAPVQTWICDDTSFPKSGRHSVGVQRQYCGALGKIANCQATPSLVVATDSAHLPIDMALYLGPTWADDPARRAAAQIPEHVCFKTKPELIHRARAHRRHSARRRAGRFRLWKQPRLPPRRASTEPPLHPGRSSIDLGLSRRQARTRCGAAHRADSVRSASLGVSPLSLSTRQPLTPLGALCLFARAGPRGFARRLAVADPEVAR